MNPTRKYQVTKEIEIEAPIESAWEVGADFNDVYLWAPSVTESHGITQKERCVGAGRQCTIDGFGVIDEFITEWNEGEGFAYHVVPFGPFAGSESYWKLTKLGERRTRLSVSLNYDVKFGPMGALLNAMMLKGKLESSLPGVLESFKKRVETGALVRPRIEVPQQRVA